jgi:hypothetical protein
MNAYANSNNNSTDDEYITLHLISILLTYILMILHDCSEVKESHSVVTVTIKPQFMKKAVLFHINTT